jgi:phage/plasmid-like protein (TIGR03299 family)
MIEGNAMFSVRETPWHGLGKVIQDAPSIEEGIKLAGLDWQVELHPLFLSDARKVPNRAMVRATYKSILGVVGPKYQPLQNTEAFGWFQPFIDAKSAHLTTAGSLNEGRRVWVMAEIGDPMTILKGDEIRRFVLLSNSHDGTQAVRVGFTPIRVVCANTLAMAQSDAQSQLLRMRHTKGLKASMDQVREVMNLANSEFEATAEQYRRLAASKVVSRDDLRKYVKRVMQLTAKTNEQGEETEELTKKSAEVQAAIMENFDSGRGTSEVKKSKGTWWGAYNSVTEYLSYQRGKTADKRLDSLWFGDGFGYNEDALDVALEMAA